MIETALEEILKIDKDTKKIFLGVFARDELPKRVKYPSCFILNTQPRSQEGEHWLAIYFDHKRNCYFFDSYGNSPKYFGLDKYIMCA